MGSLANSSLDFGKETIESLNQAISISEKIQTIGYQIIKDNTKFLKSSLTSLYLWNVGD